MIQLVLFERYNQYQEIPFKAIIEPLVKGGSLYSQLCESKHMQECTSSCYDCIRDFSNQSIHSILDWRLGLDIARLANNSDAKIDFNSEYWKDYLSITIKNILSLQGFSVAIQNGVITGNDLTGKKYAIIHPLWSQTYVDKILNDYSRNVRRISIFDISKLK